MGTLVLKNIFLEVLEGCIARPPVVLVVPANPPTTKGTQSGATWRLQQLDLKPESEEVG